MTRFCISLLLAAAICLAVGCDAPPPRDTHAENQNVIQEMEMEVWKTVEAKDLESCISYFADDALALYPNTPVLKGKDAIRESWRATFALPGFAMSGQPVKVEVARSGDLAYVQGIYSQTVNDAAGKPKMDRGKYVAIYKKQADGTWKTVIDIANSDLPR